MKTLRLEINLDIITGVSDESIRAMVDSILRQKSGIYFKLQSVLIDKAGK